MASSSSSQQPPQQQQQPLTPPIEVVNEPHCLQELTHEESIMAITVSDKYIFAGTHTGQISVWSLATFELVHRFQGHKRHIEKLLLAETTERPILISTAGDAIVSIWCPNTFERLYEIYWEDPIGDVFSCAYSKQSDTLYIGAQNRTIQWIRLSDPARRSSPDSECHPNHRELPFFDSLAISGARTPRRRDDREALIPPARETLKIDRNDWVGSPHDGMVHAMILARGPTVLVDPDEEVLITGGGEGWIKMWQIKDDPRYDGRPGWDSWPDREIMLLGDPDIDAESIYTLAIDGSFLYSGKLRGVIELWDLDTKQKLRVLKDHYGFSYRRVRNPPVSGDGVHGLNIVRPQDPLIYGNVMSVSMAWGYLWSAATTGTVVRWSTVHSNHKSEKVSQKYECLARWHAHPGKINVSATTTYEGHNYYITGGNDNKLNVWRVDGIEDSPDKDAEEVEPTMVSSLRDFVAYKTVSARPEFKEDCHKGASYLCNLFRRHGAEVKMLTTTDKATDKSHNPVVYALFKGKREPAQDRKRILFYGHYDVVPADYPGDRDTHEWTTDPFKMEGRDGYLYGRGVSDNKGPIMAALYAVTDLLQDQQLDSDIIFLIEGEEEFRSRGFQETIRENKALIGKVDYILLANSYWVDDETPCLTYGLRGLLRATVCVDSSLGDLHSGMYGSRLVDQPHMEVAQLTSTLMGKHKKIMLPNFYDNILPMTREEDSRFDDIAEILHRHHPDRGTLDDIKTELVTRWREPNFTLHRIDNSGVDDTVMSSHASAVISFRLVPGQQVDEICASLVQYLHAQFAELGSKNKLNIKIDNKAEPWLGDTTNEIFKTLEQAVIQAWGLSGSARNPSPGGISGPDDDEEPQSSASTTADKNKASSESANQSNKKLLYIREGGSIPAIRFLEKEFDAPVAHLPCGQASDSAHLENERIRLLNLIRCREIFGEVFRKL